MVKNEVLGTSEGWSMVILYDPKTAWSKTKCLEHLRGGAW
jgi:hypothetical protein